MNEQIITFKTMTEKIQLRPKLLSEHDFFPAALYTISCDKTSVVMIGHGNNIVLFLITILAVF